MRVKPVPSVLPLGELVALEPLSESDDRWEVLLPPNLLKKDMVSGVKVVCLQGCECESRQMCAVVKCS